MNLSLSGVSLSAGPRGASITFGRRGTFLNTGIPGTGLYSRGRIDTPSAPRKVASTPGTSKVASAPGKITVSATIRVEHDGTIKFLDADGQPLSQEWIDRAKREKGDAIRNLIQTCCDDINAKVEALGTIHVQTPAPHERIRYEAQKFDSPSPMQSIPKPHGFFGWLLKSTRARIDADNANRQAGYEQSLKEWQAAKAAFDGGERARRVLLEERVLSDVEAMEEVLEGSLKSIAWPRETTMSAEVNDGGRVALLEVDLPEVEDMPKRSASVPSRGYKLTVKEMSGTKIQKLYMQHVHGIGFRIIGEAFAVLPSAQEVILSAFSQRPDKATGTVSDDYLYSVRIKRGDWSAIDFGNLEGLDVIAALERFELRRHVTKTGVFRPIAPIAAAV